MKKTKQKVGKRVRIGQRIALSLFFLVGVGVIITAGVFNSENAKGYVNERACNMDPACVAAREAAESAKASANEASGAANYYQQQVNALNSQIANLELDIASTEAQIKDFNNQIETTQKKLRAEQNALAELLIKMHFEGDAEPITILAGASSISDLAEKATRDDVAKRQISSVAASIKTLKKELEDNKAEVEKLLAEQQSTRESLASLRSEQQELIAKYKNDAAAYEAKAKAEMQRQQELAQQVIDDNPQLFGGDAYNGDDPYGPWLKQTYGKSCPTSNWYSGGYALTGTGWYSCECTSYVAYRFKRAYGREIPMWHNAAYWKNYADSNSNYYTDKNPTDGSIGWTAVGEFGHVFWVEYVSGGYVYITEYNNSSATKNLFRSTLGYVPADEYYGGTKYAYWWRFGSRKISVAEAQRNFWFIHLK